MSRSLKLLTTVLATFTIFALTTGKVGAAPEDRMFTGETHSPNAYSQTPCGPGVWLPVDFAAYPSNVQFDALTGSISYTMNVQWRRCTDTVETRAFAIYGTSDLCPLSGTYQDSGDTYDCVKYIGDPAYSEPGNRLECVEGINDACVTDIFPGVRRLQNQPSTTGESYPIPMTVTDPYWALRADSGTFSIGGNMCAYYKLGPNFRTPEDVRNGIRCVDIRINVSWAPKPVTPTVACPASSISITTEPGASFNSTATLFTLSGGENDPRSLDYTITNNFSSVVLISPTSGSVPHNGSSSRSGTISGTAPGSPGVYTGTYRVNVTGASGSPVTCNISLTVVNKPYFKVYGGDVLAGAGARPGPDTSGCINGTAQIAGWARGGGTFRYFGSGSQLATFALNKITDFSSGQAHVATFTDPDNLTFASSGTPGGFGGNFGQSNVSCATGYWQTSGVDEEPGPNLNATSSGTYIVDRPYVLEAPGNNDLNNGQRITIYVDGDVFIEDDITYSQSAAYASIDDMPAFRLIARGNIYIDADVSRLDGLFVSMPRSDGTGGGTFYSCAKKNADGTFNPPTEDQLLRGNCRWTFLTVYGAVIADTVKLNRTGGSLADSGSSDLDSWNNNLGGPFGPAERFIFSPELWLTGAFRPGGGVDSIRTLPPVL